MSCPICGKPSHADYHPFCCRRCADVDLGRWLKGSYALPAGPEDDAGTLPSIPPPDPLKPQ